MSISITSQNVCKMNVLVSHSIGPVHGGLFLSHNEFSSGPSNANAKVLASSFHWLSTWDFVIYVHSNVSSWPRGLNLV